MGMSTSPLFWGSRRINRGQPSLASPSITVPERMIVGSAVGAGAEVVAGLLLPQDDSSAIQSPVARRVGRKRLIGR
jgi:hypothetical protein